MKQIQGKQGLVREEVLETEGLRNRDSTVLHVSIQLLRQRLSKKVQKHMRQWQKVAWEIPNKFQ